MGAPPWLAGQRQQQQHQHHKPHHLIFRSTTPPPPRPRSAATENSPVRGQHVIPRSHSVLHARPPSAGPPSSTSIASPSPLDQHRQPILGNSQANSHAHQPPEGRVGIGSHVQVDYSAIQRIAEGVERMVRSWTSENSCRAQVYAKAYDSLHAAVARGKDQVASQHLHNPPQEPVSSSSCTEPSPFKLNPHSDTLSSQLLAVHNLQSPADPHLVEMAPCIFDMHDQAGDTNLIDNEEQILRAHQQVQEGGGQTSYGGLAGGYNVANLSIGAPAYATTDLAGTNSLLMGNGELLCTEGPQYPIDQDVVKKFKSGNNICAHNHTQKYPIRLGLINEDDDTEQSARSIANSAQYSHNQLDNLRVEYDGREVASVHQHGRGQQGELAESGRVALHLQQQFERSNRLQNTPFLIRNDVINSNSLVKSTFRSRTPSSLRLGALSNTDPSNSLEVYREGSKIERRVDVKYAAKVKELEISLLECATEYEVQLVEMKMKMLQMKSEFRQKSAPGENKLALCKPLQSTLAQDAQSNSKPNKQGNSSPELPIEQSLEPTNLKRRAHKEKYLENVPPITKPKTRVDGHVQRKSSSEDSEKIVTCLQKLLSKKEQELLNSKLREKELAGQVHELQTSVQRGRVTQMEPKKLLSLLMALSEWLQSVKTGVLNDDPNAHRKAYQNVHALAHLRMNLEEPQNVNRIGNNQSPRLENLAAIVNKEIKTLQEILGKLTPHRRRLK
ncbi:hypothetical protein GOP47_0001491 [Adiantum capillus-veneris]|uniref:Uncharacterized protein n=1 Tax=Adiantum capillus-veneris TaxID=13818 RepID=A0A9D4V8T1_ADICA|nr:hypothetical protein GOP47_0001491 [Adiantum capillus-veneris]